jgi:hypothetical protein
MNKHGRRRRPTQSGTLAVAVLLSTVLAIFACKASHGAPEQSQRSALADHSGEHHEAGPRHDLSVDEEQGGHTLSRHVGRSDEQLRERLQREPDISAASTYSDRESAEQAVGAAIHDNQDRLQRWLQRRGGHPNLVLDYYGDRPVGRTLRRGQDRTEPCSHAIVVLRWLGRDEYYVLTSYPECR